MPLTPHEVKNKTFSPTRFKPGYNEDEVDAFLDEVEQELARLLAENADLRRRVKELEAGAPAASSAGYNETGSHAILGSQGGSRGSGGQSSAPNGASPFASSPHSTGHIPVVTAYGPSLTDTGQMPVMTSQMPSPVAPAPVAPQAPAPAMNNDTEELLRRTLVLAQKTADEAVRDARAEAERIRSEARREAEARLGGLEAEKRRLEAQVEQLRAFEREYRLRLKGYLETQLRELEDHTSDSGGPGGAGSPFSGNPSLNGGNGTPALSGSGAPMGGARPLLSQSSGPAGSGNGAANSGRPHNTSPFAPANPSLNEGGRALT